MKYVSLIKYIYLFKNMYITNYVLQVMETGEFSDLVEKNLPTIKAPTSPDLSISSNNAETKHLMLVPPHLIQQIQNANVIEIFFG